jgi:gamma-D-glutamyl-L-lysine dipeptidyl-peptidase
MARVIPAVLAALMLPAAAHATTASVRVTVANVWARPGTATIPTDFHVWPTGAVTYSQRLGLVGHMPTQVLFGEQVVVLGKRGAWTKIAVPDQPSPLDSRGYPGWVLSAQLGPALAPRPTTVTVTARGTRLTDGMQLSFATRLPSLGRKGGTVVVETPGGTASIAPTAVAPLPVTRADIVRTAELFLGLRYLWGGLSTWGMDCSGLTWAAYRAHGITIPRDADAQFAAGRPVALASAQPGDLLFYGVHHVHHVAMYLGHDRMIEAPNSASDVRISPVRAYDFAGARSFYSFAAR